MDHEDRNGAGETRFFAHEIRRESDRLRQLAEELQAREKDQEEMRANYPHLKQAVYAFLREKFTRDLPPLPDKNLRDVAIEEGALPVEAFIDELQRTAAGPAGPNDGK